MAAPGTAGDAAVFEVVEGPAEWRDVAANVAKGEPRLVPQLTVFGGEVVWRVGS